jgi:hypothetical protein
MYLEMIKPFLVLDTSGKPKLVVRAWLRCPHCFEISEEVAASLVLQTAKWEHDEPPKQRGEEGYNARNPGFRSCGEILQGYSYQSRQQLQQQRSCDQCGVVSGWPKKDKEKGEQALAISLNVEWVREQLVRLQTVAPYKAFLEGAAAEERAKKSQVLSELD